MSAVVISGDTSGTITLQAPAVSGNTTLNLPASSGTIALNGPAFSAYQSSAQTIATATLTKIQFQTKEFDTNNNFDNTTNYRFTPTVAGYYQVNATVSTGVSGATYIDIFKNGVTFKRGIQTAGAAFTEVIVSALVFLNGSTDYVEIYFYQANGSNATLNAQENLTYFQASMVRGA